MAAATYDYRRMDATPVLAWETVPVTDDLMVPLRDLGRVLVCFAMDGERRCRHYHPYRDPDGWYVRVGRGGKIKYRLRECDVLLFQGEPALHEFPVKDDVVTPFPGSLASPSAAPPSP
jgi:hypothetical protein